MDVALLNEPFVFDGRIAGLGPSLRIFSSGPDARTAIAICNPTLVVSELVVTRDLVAVCIGPQEDASVLATLYCPPSDDLDPHLLALERLVVAHHDKRLFVAGDFNAHSIVWGPQPTDARGTSVLEMIVRLDLTLHNDPNSKPTFCSTNGKSWIDLLLTHNVEDGHVQNWRISDRISMSDHQLMEFEIGARKGFASPPSKRWDTSNLNWLSLRQGLLELSLSPDTLDPSAWDLDDLVLTINLRLEELCFQNRRGHSSGSRRRQPIWWTANLREQRSRLRALRRRFQATTDDPALRLARKTFFKKEMAAFKRSVSDAKKKSFKDFLGRVVIKDAFGAPYKLAKNPNSSPSLIHRVRCNDGTLSADAPSSRRAILEYHFPTVIYPPSPPLAPSCPEGDAEEAFSPGEIYKVFSDLPTGKAPGEDGFSLSVIRELFDTNPEWFSSILNECWRRGIFPRPWKRARVVLFPKQGKDPEERSSYRPICLLPVWGKILDKLMTGRLVFFLESNNMLSPLQFGFRRNRSTTQALIEARDFIQRNRAAKRVSCMISLDMKNAFNSLRWDDIMRILLQLGAPLLIRRLVSSFLSDRFVSTEGLDATLGYNLGVPQGSCCGPVLWLLVADVALRARIPDPDIQLQAFADDFLFLISATAPYHFTRKGNLCTTIIDRWARDHGLHFSPGKSSFIMFPVRKSIAHVPSIFLRGERLQQTKKLLYLGVVFDPRLKFTAHLHHVQEKMAKFHFGLTRVCRATWGLGPDIVKSIYKAATEKMLTYASPVWYRDLKYINTKLCSIQRIPLLSICRGYRTVSTDALPVLSGCIPLDIRVRAEVTSYLQLHSGDGTVESPKRPIPPPWLASRVPWVFDSEGRFPYSAFTDGSKIGGRVGCGLVLFHGEMAVSEEKWRLNDESTVYVAELYALKRAIELAGEEGVPQLDIFTDSRSSLMALNST